jgi:hypothetical protein
MKESFFSVDVHASAVCHPIVLETFGRGSVHRPGAAQQRALGVDTELCGVPGKSSTLQDSLCIKYMC